MGLRGRSGDILPTFPSGSTLSGHHRKGTAQHRLVVIGQGYVGLAVSMQAVEAGLDVVGLDLSEHRISDLAAGHS